MDRRMLRLLSLFLLLSSGFISFAHAKLENWNEYKSQNFTLYSDLDKSDVEKALTDFEIFRTTLFEVLNLDKSRTFVPVEVYAFKDYKDYDLVKPGRNVAGFFTPTTRGPIMVVGPGRLSDLDLNTLYHEYLHYLVRTNSSFRYPGWFDEGIAELYSSVEYNDEIVIIGNPSRLKPRTQTKLLDLETLLTINRSTLTGGKLTGRYYATAWLFTHFLRFSGDNGFDDYNASLNQFLILYNQGIKPLEAYKQSFAVSLDEMQKKLRRYRRKLRLSALSMTKPEINLDYQSQAMEQGQLYANLSSLAFSVGQQETSTKLLQQAMKLNNAKALSVNAFLLVREDKTEEAIALLDELVRRKNLSAEALLNIGQAYKELSERLSERQEEMRRLATYYLERSKKSGSYSQTLVFLADLYWQAGEKEKAAEEIIGAVSLLPSSTYFNLIAGSYMVELKNEAYARFFLGNVINWSNDPKQIEQAQLGLASFE